MLNELIRQRTTPGGRQGYLEIGEYQSDALALLRLQGSLWRAIIAPGRCGGIPPGQVRMWERPDDPRKCAAEKKVRRALGPLQSE
eukprot:jgi/Botrbrau1/342/Bobra.110_2s0001.1